MTIKRLFKNAALFLALAVGFALYTEAILQSNSEAGSQSSTHFLAAQNLRFSDPIHSETREVDITHALPTISVEHNNIHAGRAFAANNASSVANSAALSLSFTTPNSSGNEVHLRAMSVQTSEGPCLFEFMQTSGNTSGTTATFQNRKLNSSAVCTLATPKWQSTITTSTVIQKLYIGGTGARGNSADALGSASSDIEFILAPSTQYAVRATNLNGSSAYVSMTVDVYEEDE